MGVYAPRNQMRCIWRRSLHEAKTTGQRFRHGAERLPNENTMNTESNGRFLRTTAAVRIARFILLALPWVFFTSYRPGELLLISKTYIKPEEWTDLPFGMPTALMQAFGDSVSFSILSFGTVCFGFGCYYISASNLTLKCLVANSTTAVLTLSLPVMALRLGQVLDQWGFVHVFPTLRMTTTEYVTLQNVCSFVCGLLLLAFTWYGKRALLPSLNNGEV